MSQTLTASTLLAVPMAPLVGALLAGILGTKFGGNWMGRRMSHSLTILGVLLSFVLSAMTLKSVVMDGARLMKPSTPGWWWGGSKWRLVSWSTVLPR
jgi:NADH-quinone oxidoreductase subunit L